ncbi:hypothetical protein ACFFRR_011433 [Megaselia abdita]
MKSLILVLSVFLLQTSANSFNKSDVLDLRRLSEGFFKEAFTGYFKRMSKEDLPTLDKCTEQLYTIVDNLESEDPLTFYHSFEVFDSWGKLPSGITYGHLLDLGNYQQCIHIDFTTLSTLTRKETNVVGKYCQAKVPIEEIVKLVRPQIAFSEYFRGHVDGPAKDPPIGVGIGICMPKECDSKKMAFILTEALNGTKVTVSNCSTNDKPDYEAIDYVAFSVFGLIGLLLIVSTFYDWYTERLNLQRNESYLAFSLIHNGQKLFAINVKPNANSINCLHGIRSLSMVWVIFGHTLLWYLLIPMMNLRKVDDWKQTAMALVFETGIISVDTFFFLSGLLISWMGLKELEKNNGRINVVMMYVHRLFRLVPMIGIVILFVLSIMKFCGSGPNWPIFLLTHKYPCEKTWWRTFLFIQNYENDMMCIPQTWYLAVDMQLFIISPVILVCLYKWGKKFVPVIVLAGALSIGCVYGIYIKNNFRQVIAVNDKENSDRMAKTYYVTHTRYTIWLMGILFGYILTQFKNKEVKIPLVYNLIAWAATFTVIFSVVFGPYNSQQVGYESSAAEAASYDAFTRVAWGVALSWIIFACHHGYGGIINGFLSNPIWQVMSRLSFCMYMTHFTMQVIIYGNFQTSVYFSNFDAMGKFWISFGFTLMASIILVLTCEAPIIALEKMIFSRGKPKKTSEKTMKVEIEYPEKV